MARPGARAASRSSRYLTAVRSSALGGGCPASSAASTAATDRSAPRGSPPRRSAALIGWATPCPPPAGRVNGTSLWIEAQQPYNDHRQPPSRSAVDGTLPPLGCR